MAAGRGRISARGWPASRDPDFRRSQPYRLSLEHFSWRCERGSLLRGSIGKLRTGSATALRTMILPPQFPMCRASSSGGSLSRLANGPQGYAVSPRFGAGHTDAHSWGGRVDRGGSQSLPGYPPGGGSMLSIFQFNGIAEICCKSIIPCGLWICIRKQARYDTTRKSPKQLRRGFLDL